MPPRLRTMAWIAPVLATGCGMGLPLPERIISLRPLALRTEAIDDTAEPDAAVRAELLPFERARVRPFFADAEGSISDEEVAAFEPVWLRCSMQPFQGVFGCVSDALPLAVEDLPDCPPVSVPTDLGEGELPQAPSPCRIVEGTPALPEVVVPLDFRLVVGGDLEVTMIAHDPSGDVGTDACLRAVLGQTAIDEGCIVASTRVAVGPDAAILQQAIDLGFVTEDEVGSLPDEIPAPDTHPRIERFTVQVFDENDVALTDAMDLARGDVIEAPSGTRIEVETVAPESDLQTYLIASNEQSFDEAVEAYEGSWFRTWGELLSPQSDDPLSTNSWRLVKGPQDELDEPPGGQATMVYVLRDGRQGVDWFWFTVDVAPAQ